MPLGLVQATEQEDSHQSRLLAPPVTSSIVTTPVIEIAPGTSCAAEKLSRPSPPPEWGGKKWGHISHDSYQNGRCESKPVCSPLQLGGAVPAGTAELARELCQQHAVAGAPGHRRRSPPPFLAGMRWDRTHRWTDTTRHTVAVTRIIRSEWASCTILAWQSLF